MAKKKQIIETIDVVKITHYKLHIDFDGTRHGYKTREETIIGISSRREIAEHINKSDIKPTYILVSNLTKGWAEFFNVSKDGNLSVRKNYNW